MFQVKVTDLKAISAKLYIFYLLSPLLGRPHYRIQKQHFSRYPVTAGAMRATVKQTRCII